MSLRLGALEDALLHAGCDPTLAAHAAEESADYAQQVNTLRGELRVLKWLAAFLLVLALGLFWLAIMGGVPQ